MTTINTESDFLRALTEHPEWRAAVRAQILGEELLLLPVRFNAFVEEQREANAEFRESIAELKEFNAEQKKENAEFRGSIAELRESTAELKESVAELQVSVAELQVSHAELRESVTELQVSVAELQVSTAELQVSTAELKESNQRIVDDVGILKGDLVGRAAWDRHQDILDQLGFNLVRMLTRNDLNNLANRSDTTGIAGADLRSFFRADLIMEVTGDDDSPQYIAMEASYTADERDTDRVMRNCRFMQQFTDRPAHGVISSLRNDHHVESLVNDRVVHWFQLAERDLHTD